MAEAQKSGSSQTRKLESGFDRLTSCWLEKLIYFNHRLIYKSQEKEDMLIIDVLKLPVFVRRGARDEFAK